MKSEIEWPSAIGGSNDSKNAHLQLRPKGYSDSSCQPIVWPTANGGSDDTERNARLQRYPKIGSDSSVRSIVRPSAVGGTKEDKHLCGGFRPSVRTGIIRENRPSAWIRGPKRARIDQLNKTRKSGSKTRIKIGTKLNIGPLTRWINLTARGRHVLCFGLDQPFGVSMQRPRRCPPGLSLRANPSGRARRLSTRYTAKENLK
jgi:hypothetical protein